MKIKKCCKKIDNIHIATISSDLPEGTPYYWTGGEGYEEDIAITYCPFCGSRIKIKVRKWNSSIIFIPMIEKEN